MSGKAVDAHGDDEYFEGGGGESRGADSRGRLEVEGEDTARWNQGILDGGLGEVECVPDE